MALFNNFTNLSLEHFQEFHLNSLVFFFLKLELLENATENEKLVLSLFFLDVLLGSKLFMRIYV
jgi:hypothetical protein